MEPLRSNLSTRESVYHNNMVEGLLQIRNQIILPNANERMIRNFSILTRIIVVHRIILEIGQRPFNQMDNQTIQTLIVIIGRYNGELRSNNVQQ